MEYYDCHTHLNHEPLSNNSDRIATLCESLNITLNNIGTNLTTSQQAIDVAKKHANVFASVGIHPNDVNDISWNDIKGQIIKWLDQKKKNKIVAIGETGLDYHYSGFDKQKQMEFLIEHTKLAKLYNLPLMIHVRDAHEDMINFIKRYKTPTLQIIIHCYTDNGNIVKQYVDLGCFISIPGVITFKKANELKQAVHQIPLNKLLCETDAPWLTPEPHRGKYNSPEYIPLIVSAIANELQIDVKELTKIIYKNSIDLFKIS